MNDVSWIAVGFVVAMTLVTIGLGIYATRMARSASDFFVAGRSVSVFWNASAISGEYLSAASFMGIAGLLMKNGYDALWYPVCYATGYLFLLLFIAGPLRRFGAYTIPDFAEGRFDSPTFRKIAVTFVLFIGFFYTMPQMKGAGVVLGAILGWPYWAGIVVVGAVITFNVALGGMKGITFVQAFQYWAKLFAIALPIFVIQATTGGYAERLEAERSRPSELPTIAESRTVSIKGAKSFPANVMVVPETGSTRITFPDGAKLARISPASPAGSTDPNAPLVMIGSAPGSSRGLGAASDVVIEAGATLVSTGRATRLEFAEPARAEFAAGSPAPNAPANVKWSEPFGPLTSKHGYPLLYTYSLIVALICGTAGLPHILVRFYTNPDGRAAKRTTLWVMAMLGAFYVFPPIWGTIGRGAMPWLYADNSTDSVVIRLPAILESKLLGEIASGITSAGAFAAFMSTFSGLLVSMSGALAHDIYGKILRPSASPESRMLAFKIAAVVIGAVSMALGLLVESFDIAMMVGWAFAIAAASYFPLLLLGSWWRGLTKQGAGAGMLIGGLLSLSAIIVSMLLDKKILDAQPSPLVRSLLEQPAIWGVPLAIGVMVLVSKLTPSGLPADVALKMLRLHAPEELGLSKNYIEH
ncbi:MAG: cation acetate symporter [Isosphaeraceae bacterium]|nr:cation acetate symporter [Isosphaeraceae bacterium]